MKIGTLKTFLVKGLYFPCNMGQLFTTEKPTLSRNKIERQWQMEQSKPHVPL